MKTNYYPCIKLRKLILKFSLLIIFLPVYLLAQSGDDYKAPTIFNDNTLKMTIVGNGYSDQTYVIIVPGSTTGFDSQFDAYKLMGITAAPQLYSIISCCNLSVNAIPELYTNMTVQMGYRVGATTSYTINFEGLYTFGNDTTITLEDTKENVFTELMVDSVYTFTGEPSDDTHRFIIHYNFPVKLEARVFLEGPYNGSDMNTSLNSSGELPLSQPFNTTPWNYSGPESVVSIPNADVVDWILLEVRDTTSALMADESTRTERKAAFLLNDGSIVGLDGVTMPEFIEPVKNDVFLVVWHRNHLGIISANPLTRLGGVYSYDFSSAASQALGGTTAQKDLGSGVFGMFGGDGNADGTIDNTDKISFWQVIAGKKGYLSADYDLNGQVNNGDKNEYWYPNLNQVTQIP